MKKITNYKSQITNKLQFRNYKLQNKEAPFGQLEKNAAVQFIMTDNRFFSLTLTTNTNTRNNNSMLIA
jgi:hypothetical protein